MLDDDEIKSLYELDNAAEPDVDLENHLSHKGMEYTEKRLRERYLNSMGYSIGFAGTSVLLGGLSIREFLEGNTDLAAGYATGSVAMAGIAKAHYSYIHQEISDTYSKFSELKDES